MRDQKERGNRRVGIPNIPLRAAPWYLTVFTIITIYLTVTNTLFIVVTEKIAGWQAVQYVVTGELLKAGGVSLITSPIIVEVGRMVLAEIWSDRRERKAREEGREAGLTEGREEGAERANRRWSEWNQRRLIAEGKGEPFTEPPPSL